MEVKLPLTSQIAPPPSALLAKILAPAKSPASPPKTQLSPLAAAILGDSFQMPPDGSVPEGQRNIFLASTAGWLRSNGLANQALLDALLAINTAKCSPPLGPAEVASVAKSIGQYPGNASARARFDLTAGQVTLSATIPPPRTAVWGDMIVAGKYVVLGGPGGVSKTMLALGLAVQIALGQSWASRPVLQGLSMLFLGEEDSEEVYRRLNAVARNLTPTDWPSIMNCVRAFPAAGKDIRLVHLQGDNPEATGFDSDIIALADEFAAQQACPVRLIVIDHARLALSGNLNDAAHVTELTRQLTNIAVVTGAAVMLLAHSPKSTLGKQEETNAADIAGSAAFVDNSRCTMVVTTLRADEGKALGIPETACSSYARLMVVKNNYGATGTKIYFHRRYDADFQVAPLEPVTLQPVPKAIASAALTVGIINAVTAHPGRWSRTGFTKHNSGCKGKLAASERDIAAEVDRLINSGRLALRAPTENERIDHNLSHNVREVLVPGNGGSESKVRGET